MSRFEETRNQYIEKLEKLENLETTNEKIFSEIQELIWEFRGIEIEATLPEEIIDIIQRASRAIKLVLTEVSDNNELFEDIERTKDPLWMDIRPLDVQEELLVSLGQKQYHALNIKPGEKVMINLSKYSKGVAEEIVRLCLENDIEFDIDMIEEEQFVWLLNNLTDEQLGKLADLKLDKYKEVKKIIVTRSSVNQGLTKRKDQEKEKFYYGLTKDISRRIRNGEIRYNLTLVPTEEDAELDGIPYSEYLNLYFQLCDQPWEEIREAQTELIKEFDEAKELHITNNDGTDLTLNIEGQTFANSVINANIPGSEVFSSPKIDGVNGRFVAKGKFQDKFGNFIENITLEFKNGRVESYKATTGKEHLKKMITIDDGKGEGTRHVGEIGIGTNPHLRRHVMNPLFVEKIGGSFHLAIGECYSYEKYGGVPVNVKNGNSSENSIHWDITAMLRGKDGKMSLGGRLIQENGNWTDPKYNILNQGWGALPKERQPNWWKENYPNGYED